MPDYKQLMLVYGIKDTELTRDTRDLIEAIASCEKAVNILKSHPTMKQEDKDKKINENNGKIARFDKRIQHDILELVNGLEPKEYKEFKRDPEAWKQKQGKPNPPKPPTKQPESPSKPQTKKGEDEFFIL